MRKGFTLVELMLFTGVFAIMVGAIVSFALLSEFTGRRAERIADVEQGGAHVIEVIRSAIERADIVAYPPQGAVGEALVLLNAFTGLQSVYQPYHGGIRIVEIGDNPKQAKVSFLAPEDMEVTQMAFLHLTGERGVSFSFQGKSVRPGLGMYVKRFHATATFRASKCTDNSQCATGWTCCTAKGICAPQAVACTSACASVLDCQERKPTCTTGCDQRVPICDLSNPSAGVCRAIYGGPCTDCSFCGDGYTDASRGEQCDDGCMLAQVPPVCDDGPPFTDTDACTTACLPASCGDGFVQHGVEECDDGNRANSDGCDLACKKEEVCTVARINIAFVIDTSGSMQWDSRLDAAKAAVLKFLDAMEFPKDQAAIIGFSDVGLVKQALTINETALKGAVNSLQYGGGTNIQHGLELAKQQLQGASTKVKIVILLTDGAPNLKTALQTSCIFVPPPNDDCGVIAEAKNVKDPPLKARVFAIGLGVDSDTAELLKKVASDAASYYAAPKPEDLLGIYGLIADQICPCNATDLCNNDADCAPGFECKPGSGGTKRCELPGTVPCDDGNETDYDACTNSCFAPICGDGVTSPSASEQCDDGGKCANNLTKACTKVNAATVCGAGVACAPQSSDGCSASCKVEPFCGNGKTEGSEQCDDGGQCFGGTSDGAACFGKWGNVNAGCPGGGVCTPRDNDGCSATCIAEWDSPPYAHGCYIDSRLCETDDDCNDPDNLLCGTCAGGDATTYRGECNPNKQCVKKTAPILGYCPAPLCCNRIVEGREQCDDGKRCDNTGNVCNVDDDCGGGQCLGFNNDGCTSDACMAGIAACSNCSVCSSTVSSWSFSVGGIAPGACDAADCTSFNGPSYKISYGAGCGGTCDWCGSDMTLCGAAGAKWKLTYNVADSRWELLAGGTVARYVSTAPWNCSANNDVQLLGTPSCSPGSWPATITLTTSGPAIVVCAS